MTSKFIGSILSEDIIFNNDTLNENEKYHLEKTCKIYLKQKTNLLYINEMNYDEIVGCVANLLEGEDKDIDNINPKKVRKLESTFKKIAKYGLATFISMFVGGLVLVSGNPALGNITRIVGVFLFYKYRKDTDQCRKMCKGKEDSCQRKCEIDVCNKVIHNLKSEMSKCSKTKDPEKCKKIISKFIIKWESKLSKLKINK